MLETGQARTLDSYLETIDKKIIQIQTGQKHFKKMHNQEMIVSLIHILNAQGIATNQDGTEGIILATIPDNLLYLSKHVLHVKEIIKAEDYSTEKVLACKDTNPNINNSLHNFQQIVSSLEIVDKKKKHLSVTTAEKSKENKLLFIPISKIKNQKDKKVKDKINRLLVNRNLIESAFLRCDLLNNKESLINHDNKIDENHSRKIRELLVQDPCLLKAKILNAADFCPVEQEIFEDCLLKSNINLDSSQKNRKIEVIDAAIKKGDIKISIDVSVADKLKIYDKLQQVYSEEDINKYGISSLARYKLSDLKKFSLKDLDSFGADALNKHGDENIHFYGLDKIDKFSKEDIDRFGHYFLLRYSVEDLEKFGGKNIEKYGLENLKKNGLKKTEILNTEFGYFPNNLKIHFSDEGVIPKEQKLTNESTFCEEKYGCKLYSQRDGASVSKDDRFVIFKRDFQIKTTRDTCLSEVSKDLVKYTSETIYFSKVGKNEIDFSISCTYRGNVGIRKLEQILDGKILNMSTDPD